MHHGAIIHEGKPRGKKFTDEHSFFNEHSFIDKRSLVNIHSSITSHRPFIGHSLMNDCSKSIQFKRQFSDDKQLVS
jgi:hypothetical protein